MECCFLPASYRPTVVQRVKSGTLESATGGIKNKDPAAAKYFLKNVLFVKKGTFS
jgi:hypothetical protein